MLLSALYDYLTDADADAASIVVVVHGQRIELDLRSLCARPGAATNRLPVFRPCWFSGQTRTRPRSRGHVSVSAWTSQQPS